MSITAYAYPRAALIGNPSDGYFGKTLAFVFDNYRAWVTLEPSDKLILIPAERDRSEFAGLTELNSLVRSYGYYGGMRLLKAAVRRFYLYCETHGVAVDKNFTLSYGSDIPNQLGLAGSSAIITAALRCMFAYYGLECSNGEFANIVLSAERDELHIPAGLQDRVAQAYNHPVFMDFDRQYMAEHGFGRYEMVDLPEELRFFVAYRTDLAEGSEILHSRLRADYDSGVPEVLAAMQEWASLAEQLKQVLAGGDLQQVPCLLNRNFDLRCKVCAGSISEGNRRMVEIARSCGASAKFTGSGGAVVGTCSDEKAFAEMREKFSRYKIEIIRPRIVTEGAAACIKK